MSTVTMSYWVEKGMQVESAKVIDEVVSNVKGVRTETRFVHTDMLGNRLYTADVLLPKVGWALFQASEAAFWNCAVDGVDWDGVLADAPVFAAG